MWLSDFGHGGDDFPGHEDAAAGVVSCHVVGNDAKERSQRAWIATRPGPEKIRDGVDMAPQISARHGEAWSRPTYGVASKSMNATSAAWRKACAAG
jgi:hypothetical protein